MLEISNYTKKCPDIQHISMKEQTLKNFNTKASPSFQHYHLDQEKQKERNLEKRKWHDDGEQKS